VRSAKAHRHFFLFGSLFFGLGLAMLIAIGFQQEVVGKGSLPGLAVGLGLCLVFSRMSRIPAQVNIEEFEAETNGGLRWGRGRPRVLLTAVAALIAVSAASAWTITGSGDGFQALILAALTPIVACEYLRSRNQVREARSVVLGFFLGSLLLSIQVAPVHVPLAWLLGFLGLGLLLVALLLDWERRHQGRRSQTVETLIER
jgi:hypothetical protein